MLTGFAKEVLLCVTEECHGGCLLLLWYWQCTSGSDGQSPDWVGSVSGVEQ